MALLPLLKTVTASEHSYKVLTVRLEDPWRSLSHAVKRSDGGKHTTY